MSSTSHFKNPPVAFFGRSFSEYLDIFSLDPTLLRNTRILDVAAGPSSFSADANRLGISSVAIDPLYGLGLEALKHYVETDYNRVFAEIRKKQSLYRLGYFPSIDAAVMSRREAAGRFLADYEQGFVHSRYIGAGLPKLPFADRAFDLVLCAHLLFIYARRFDYLWHLAALRELCRVSSGEVRIHPICQYEGELYPDLPRLIGDLEHDGVESRIIDVNFEFLAGTCRTLVLTTIAKR